MNLDDLMAVWRSQDAAPLHGVDKTLLHLALRQDEAKLQKERRIERWIIYVGSAGLVAAMAVFLGMMILTRERKVMTGWDFAIGIGGAAAALLAGGAMYVGHRAQARREQRFGESLRDQLNRRIAQLDDRATIARATLVSVLLGGIGGIAILLLGYRVNQKPFSDDGYMLVSTILMCVVLPVAAGVWEIRRQARECVAAQAPAGGVAEGARCSVDSRLSFLIGQTFDAPRNVRVELRGGRWIAFAEIGDRLDDVGDRLLGVIDPQRPRAASIISRARLASTTRP